jgi:NADPH:quinone reductase-like Zn-dependent oxidoreductase
VKAAAVNPTDMGLRERGAGDQGSLVVPGMDAAGIIESVGPGVSRLRVGEKVMTALNPRRPDGGAQAQYIVVSAASVVPLPEGVSLVEASTLPMNGLTALRALELAALGKGQWLAVSGGAGLLAHYAIAAAKRQGQKVIADAKSEEAQLVRSYGADVVVQRGSRFPEAIRQEVPDGVDALLDTALLGESAFGAIRDGGVYIPVRGWGGTPGPRSIQIRPVFVGEVLERTEWLESLRDMVSASQIKLRVVGEYPPERVADAQRALAAGGLRGRAVIVF